MNMRMLATFLLCPVFLASLVCESEGQTENHSTSYQSSAVVNPSQSRRCEDDPFCQKLQKARELENRWTGIDGMVQPTFAEFGPCNSAGYDTLQKARDAGEERLKAWQEYYLGWERFAHGQSDMFTRLIADRLSSRRNLESLLESARTDEASLAERRRVLETAQRKSPAADAGEELRILGVLESRAHERHDNLLAALSKWEDAQSSSESCRKNSRDLINSIGSLRRVCESEALLWDAYYEAVEMRQRLRCSIDLKGNVFRYQSQRPPSK